MLYVSWQRSYDSAKMLELISIFYANQDDLAIQMTTNHKNNPGNGFLVLKIYENEVLHNVLAFMVEKL